MLIESNRAKSAPELQISYCRMSVLRRDRSNLSHEWFSNRYLSTPSSSIAVAEAVERTGIRLLAFWVPRNHWHLDVWPREDGEFSRFVGWLTLTRAERQTHQEITRNPRLWWLRYEDGVTPVADRNARVKAL